MAKPLEPNALALMFPPMMPDEYSSLREDISKNGLLNPIVIHEGKILDGVHRHKACLETGRKLKTIQFKELDCEGEPLQYVVSANMERRHLTVAQKACMALNIYRDEVSKSMSERTKRMHERRRKGMGALGERCDNSVRTTYRLAKIFGVGGQTIAKMAMVEKRRPDLIEAILKNKLVGGKLLTVNKAQMLAGTSYKGYKPGTTKKKEIVAPIVIPKISQHEQIEKVDMFTPLSQLADAVRKINESGNIKLSFASFCVVNGKTTHNFRDSNLQRLLVLTINAMIQKQKDCQAIIK